MIKRIGLIAAAGAIAVTAFASTAGAVSAQTRYDRQIKTWLQQPAPTGFDVTNVHSVKCIGNTIHAKPGKKITCWAYSGDSEGLGTVVVTELGNGTVNVHWNPS